MLRHSFRRLAARFLIVSAVVAVAHPGAYAENRPAAAAAAELRPLTSKQLYDKALVSTCWIVNDQGTGTGWVLDRERRLVVTNEHVVRGSDSVDVFAPVRDSGTLVRDPRHYIQNVPPLKATVIDRDRVCDLALLQLESIPPQLQSAKLAATSPESGELLRAVGALPEGSAGLWGSISGEVRGVLRRRNANGHVIMMIESTLPVNRGNSGGGVFNEVGELVGVVQSGNFGGQVHNTSMLVDITEVNLYLKEALPLVEPQDAVGWLTRATRRVGEGRSTAALADVSEAIRKDKKLVTAYVLRGMILATRGDDRTSLADFDEALRLDPDADEALLYRGIVRRNLGKLDDALADFTALIRLDVTSVDGYRQRARTHWAANNVEEAISDYTRAIEIHGKDAALYVERARAEKARQKLDAAIADFKKATELAPRNAGYLNELGLAYQSANDLDAAIATFARAATVDPTNPVYVSNLGDSLLRSGKHAVAIRAYSEAIKLSPKSTADFDASLAWYGRGDCRRLLKEYPAAIQDFTRAIELDAKVAHYWYGRGLAQRAAGNEVAAVADFREAARLDPKTYGTLTAVNPIAGSWVYRGTSNRTRIEMFLHLNGDGTFQDMIRVTTDGRTTSMENRGNYEVVGNVLKVGSKDRRFQLVGGKLTIEFADSATSLTFERLK